MMEARTIEETHDGGLFVVARKREEVSMARGRMFHKVQ